MLDRFPLQIAGLTDSAPAVDDFATVASPDALVSPNASRGTATTEAADTADVGRFQSALLSAGGEVPHGIPAAARPTFSDVARNMENNWKSSLSFAAQIGRSEGTSQLRDLLSLQIRMGRLTVDTLAFNKVASAVPQAVNELTRMH